MQPEELARQLIAARDPHAPAAAVPGPLTPGDLDAAYGVQDAVVRLLGGRTVGYKIACTSKIAQDHLGLDGPCTGRLLENRILTSPAEITAAEARFVLIEPEYAFTLGRALPARNEPYSDAEISDAVASLHPVFEVVASAYGDAWTEAGAAAVIADNAAHSALVLGAPVTDWQTLDITGQRVRLSINASLHSDGQGARALGSPLKALAWLSRHLAERGRGLAAGDLVTTGVVTDVAFLEAGDQAEADFGALGRVSIRAL